MANHFQAKKQGNCYCPEGPPPTQQEEPCEKECTGEINGQIRLVCPCDCGCKCLHSHTMVLSLGPQSEANLISTIQGTAQAYEAAGYIVLAHSVVDAGAGWILGLTVAWYA